MSKTNESIEVVSLNIEDVVADMSPEVRGRSANPTENELCHLALNIRQNGQLQPVKVYLKEGKYNLVYGFTRFGAIVKINEGFEYNGKTYPPQEMQIRAEVVDVDSEKDIKSIKILNISENVARVGLSPIDNAMNIQDLQTNYGFKTPKICELYGKDKAWVSRQLACLKLPETLQTKVHEGKISVSVANALAKDAYELTAEEQIQLVEGAGEDSEGRSLLTIVMVDEFVRTKSETPEGGEGEGEEGGDEEGGKEEGGKEESKKKTKNRTMSQLTALMLKFADEKNGSSLPVANLMKILLAYAAGSDKATDEKAEKAIKRIVNLTLPTSAD